MQSKKTFYTICLSKSEEQNLQDEDRLYIRRRKFVRDGYRDPSFETHSKKTQNGKRKYLWKRERRSVCREISQCTARIA